MMGKGKWFSKGDMYGLESPEERALKAELKRIADDLDAMHNLVGLLEQAESKDEFLLYIEGMMVISEQSKEEILRNLFNGRPEIKAIAYKLGVIRPLD